MTITKSDMEKAAQKLTPQQIEDLNDGWHIAITLGPGDIDVLHSALTLDYHDGSTVRLWERIRRDIDQQHLLSRIARLVNEDDAP